VPVEHHDHETMKFIRETLIYEGEDAYPEKLVTRPDKGVLWGLGGQLLRVKNSIFLSLIFTRYV
jgi:hypothetical protein